MMKIPIPGTPYLWSFLTDLFASMLQNLMINVIEHFSRIPGVLNLDYQKMKPPKASFLISQTSRSEFCRKNGNIYLLFFNYFKIERYNQISGTFLIKLCTIRYGLFYKIGIGQYFRKQYLNLNFEINYFKK